MTSLTTPLQESQNLSKILGLRLLIKRDDLYPSTGGGSKARKLNYIIPIALKKGYNAIVTAGSNQSNHVRSSALYAAQIGWKCIAVIHDIKPRIYEGNLKISNLAGAELRFVDKGNVKFAMDKAMNDLKNQGYNPLYIWGGGHCVEGAYAYYEAVKELNKQLGNLKPDYVFVASGTGSTQAGIEIGIRQFCSECKVIGISVAREMNRGQEAILTSMMELNTFLGNPVSLPSDIIFDDNWIGNGYEAVYPDLIETIKWAAKTEGLILDPTYSGKAFYALRMYLRNGILPRNSIVVFWHTGGLINMLASKKI